MKYMSARQAAEKWGVSQQRVVELCLENKINDAQLVDEMWIIPIELKNPFLNKNKDIKKVENFEEIEAKPFLKWAGGKGQLLDEIRKYYPFSNEKINKYAEPFIGGGAILFDILNRYDLESVYISDINADLVNTYNIVKNNVELLIDGLLKKQDEYLPLSEEERKNYYLTVRSRFNEIKVLKDDNYNIEKAILMIFLNRTCFNGLYRVNKKGEFNVPIGSYKNPTICDEKNLRAVSRKLKKVIIECEDYKKVAGFADRNTFIYFDPPYRPLTETSSFTSYTEDDFNDDKQLQLAEFVKSLSDKGVSVLVSNSDPKNTNPDDNFFDDAYSSLEILRIEASRMINSKGKKRGKIKELIITNIKRG